MPEELMNTTDVEIIFSDISTMIYDAKNEVLLRVNTSVITLYWNIGTNQYRLTSYLKRNDDFNILKILLNERKENK